MKAIGMIETYGMITAVESLDAALKSADVSLVDLNFVKGGLVSVIVSGDVAAVKASVDAGMSAGSKIGKVLSTHVIARPIESIDCMFDSQGSEKCGCAPESGDEQAPKQEPVEKPVLKKDKKKPSKR